MSSGQLSRHRQDGGIDELFSSEPAFAPSRANADFFTFRNRSREGSSGTKAEWHPHDRKIVYMVNEQLDGQLRLAQLDPLQDQIFTVRKRDARVIPFDETRIQLAIEAAFKADAGLHHDQSLPGAAENNVIRVANAVIHSAITRAVKGEALEIEFTQDLVKTKLMEAGNHSVARRYILYREERRKARALRNDRTVEGQL